MSKKAYFGHSKVSLIQVSSFEGYIYDIFGGLGHSKVSLKQKCPFQECPYFRGSTVFSKCLPSGSELTPVAHGSLPFLELSSCSCSGLAPCAVL